jgi:beta,beta-carotene 9',10'-dioxygenase
MNATVSLPGSLEAIAPFRRSNEEPTGIAASVRGEIPSWLRGELVRTCPAVFERPNWRAQHWFDGLGMLYAFEVGESSVAFRSRLLESEAARDAVLGKSRLGTFATPLVRTLWQRILEPAPRITDNTNVNILGMGEDLVAMTESNRQLVIDPATLSTRSPVAYAEDAVGSAVMSAHPHFDLERKRVVNVATKIGSKVVISIYEHGPNERLRRVIGAWQTRRVPYIHSFGLTPSHAIVIAHPFAAKPVRMLWSNRGYIDHFAWNPREGTRLVVIDRATGKTQEHEVGPFFVFHTVNAFEQGRTTLLDLLVYPSPEVVDSLRIDRLNERLPNLRPSLVRITLRPDGQAASMDTLSDVGFEFPSVNYHRVSGREHRFVWGASDGPTSEGYTSSIVKIDLRSGIATSFGDGDHVFGEPVFVAKPQAAEEDDGVLVTVGSHKSKDSSVLAIIDAKAMALVASAEVSRAIPLGFHGSFLRKSA